MNNLPSLSIVMPCLNEGENLRAAIEDALKNLDKSGIEGEVIVVNDGSTDNSFDIAKQAASLDRRVHILNKTKTMGIGRAFWDGAKLAIHQFVVMIPGDNENKVSEVLASYQLVNEVDVIIPFVPNSTVRTIDRRVISTLYRLIVNISFGTTLNYTNGTVVYNKEALKLIKLKSSGFFYQTELLVKLLRNGFLYAEVPHFLGVRKDGKSSSLSLKSFCDLSRSFVSLIVDVYILRTEGVRLDPRVFPAGSNTRRRYETADR